MLTRLNFAGQWELSRIAVCAVDGRGVRDGEDQGQASLVEDRSRQCVRSTTSVLLRSLRRSAEVGLSRET